MESQSAGSSVCCKRVNLIFLSFRSLQILPNLDKLHHFRANWQHWSFICTVCISTMLIQQYQSTLEFLFFYFIKTDPKLVILVKDIQNYFLKCSYCRRLFYNMLPSLEYLTKCKIKIRINYNSLLDTFVTVPSILLMECHVKLPNMLTHVYAT